MAIDSELIDKTIGRIQEAGSHYWGETGMVSMLARMASTAAWSGNLRSPNPWF